jgi:hypothetical protein
MFGSLAGCRTCGACLSRQKRAKHVKCDKMEDVIIKQSVFVNTPGSLTTGCASADVSRVTAAAYGTAKVVLVLVGRVVQPMPSVCNL